MLSFHSNEFQNEKTLWTKMFGIFFSHSLEQENLFRFLCAQPFLYHFFHKNIDNYLPWMNIVLKKFKYWNDANGGDKKQKGEIEINTLCCKFEILKIDRNIENTSHRCIRFDLRFHRDKFTNSKFGTSYLYYLKDSGVVISIRFIFPILISHIVHRQKWNRTSYVNI